MMSPLLAVQPFVDVEGDEVGSVGHDEVAVVVLPHSGDCAADFVALPVVEVVENRVSEPRNRRDGRQYCQDG